MSDPSNLSADEIERLEDTYDARVFKLAAIESADQETIPGEVVGRLMSGDAPLAVWREHRGLTREALAHAAGVGADDIDSVEHGGDLGPREMVAVAKALRIDAEDLLPRL